MKVERLNDNFLNFKGRNINFQKKFANTFAKIDGIGEGASIAFDFIGKAAIVPAVIMLSSNEPKEKKEYSAFKHPVAAVLQLILEVPTLLLGSLAAEKAANKGYFDNETSTRYNEKLHRDVFVKELKKSNPSADSIKQINETLNLIDKKGLSRKTTETLEDFVKNAPENSKNVLENLFREYKEAHSNLYHLKNRLCFGAAIAMTPIVCALENKLHPIIMDKIYAQEQKIEERKRPKKLTGNFISLESFKKQLGIYQTAKEDIAAKGGGQ